MAKFIGNCIECGKLVEKKLRENKTFFECPDGDQGTAGKEQSAWRCLVATSNEDRGLRI